MNTLNDDELFLSELKYRLRVCHPMRDITLMDILVRMEQSHFLQEALGDLTVKELRIVTLYFGLGDSDSHTYEAVGVLLGTSRQRIHQILQKALSKMGRELKSCGAW